MLIVVTVVAISLQFFNSRSCDLMLGGGVVDVVGLKKITARHLGRCGLDCVWDGSPPLQES